MIDPPWQEYQKKAEYFNTSKRTQKTLAWTLKELADLKIN